MPNLSVQENVPLAPLTTFKVGGNAQRFVEARTESEVVDSIRLADEIGVPIFILGGGSNVVISDDGFDGLVIKIAIDGVEFGSEEAGKVLVTAGAGVEWDTIVRECVDRGLAGVECLSGIPGLVGGTPIQNVGAYGQDVSESIVSVRCYDRRSQETVELSNAECEFAYRTSRYNSKDVGRFVVLEVKYSLLENGAPKLAYRDLIEYFDGKTPALLEVREAVLSIRSQKSMVINAADVNSQSAGSFFKNPIVSQEKYDELLRSFANIPSFPASNRSVKIPAAWLIENAGFGKGFRSGNAGISQNHTLAIVNFGGAAASEIRALERQIQQAVRDNFGIELSPEPVFIGF